MTEPEDPIAEARRLLAERTPGEWSVELIQRERQDDQGIVWTHFPSGRTIVAEGMYLPDAALIAAAPRLFAALCDRLEAAERRPQIRCPLCTDKHDPETDCAE